MNAHSWLQTLPEGLDRHRQILAALLREIERDPRCLWLQLGCSVAEGRADALSDLDAALGLSDGQWDAGVAGLPALLGRVNPIVDALYHHLPEMSGRTHLRAFVQFSNGVQLDLVAVPAHTPKGHQPENVILYDPEELLGAPWEPEVMQATPDMVREWTFLAWIALGDVAKYLCRDSTWEALERLDQARGYIWRLWAVAHELRYPAYGLTTVFDHPEVPLPPGIDGTTARAVATDIHEAALVSASLLSDVSDRAAKATGAVLPDSFAALVSNLLRRSDAAEVSIPHSTTQL